MSLIRIFPDPVLRKPAETVMEFGKKTQDLALKLRETMKSQTHGIGIAAPQIGVSKRMAIVDVSSRVPGARPLLLINPEILDARDEQPSREGCMSVPDYTGMIKRFFWVKIKWQDESGVYLQKVSTGIEAVCIQHELDHLSGMLFIDRVSSLKKDLIPRHFKAR
jgi:peptide deformylase